MTRKKDLPKFPYDYVGEKAVDYNNSEWMEKKQKETTLQCVEYLFDPTLGEYDVNDFSNLLVVDLGCGTGFSSEALSELNFKVIGIDILEDMLLKAHSIRKSYNVNQIYELVQGSITSVPVRPSSIDFIISVSAYNFITYQKPTISQKKSVINRTARYLHQILKENGRMVIEFYPKTQHLLNLFLTSFKKNAFEGYYIKGDKGGQYFILLKKGEL